MSGDSYGESSCKFKHLNLVFHGLWAFESRTHGIIARTPQEPMHKTKAGPLNYHDKQDPLKDLVDLCQTSYTLGGVRAQCNGTKNFNTHQNVIISNKPFGAGKQLFCDILMPLPREIHSVRRAPVQLKHPFGGRDGEDLNPAIVSMVQVLVYDVLDPGALKLAPKDLGAKAAPAGKSSNDPDTANLHVFAEPPGKVPSCHSIAAYKDLAKMFNLDIVPVEALFVYTSDPNISGLTAFDLETFVELKPPKAEFTSGSNCDSLVVDNRQLDEP
jgi:hypothetical protein